MTKKTTTLDTSHFKHSAEDMQSLLEESGIGMAYANEEWLERLPPRIVEFFNAMLPDEALMQPDTKSIVFMPKTQGLILPGHMLPMVGYVLLRSGYDAQYITAVSLARSVVTGSKVNGLSLSEVMATDFLIIDYLMDATTINDMSPNAFLELTDYLSYYLASGGTMITRFSRHAHSDEPTRNHIPLFALIDSFASDWEV